ncbi:hypothetical protein [Microbispora sp. NPDC049125]|uniref:hypothetical protein n=1 Tax=Microbispora sp. NPDC049125 TaxID=3154929 RepID=UPI003466A498
MGIARNASAISAGALALALGGGLPLAAAAPAQAFDCGGGGGLVSGVTGAVCSVVDGAAKTVDGATDVVDRATGGATGKVTDTVDDTVSGVTGTAGSTVSGAGKAVDGAVKKTTDAVAGTVDTVGKTVGKTLSKASGQTGSSSGGTDAGNTVGSTVGNAVGNTVKHTVSAVTGAVGSRTASPVASPAQKVTDGLARTIGETCLPVVSGGACEDAGSRRAGEEKPSPPKVSVTPGGVLPTDPYRPVLRPRLVGSGRPAELRVNPDRDAVIPLLWPGQKLPDLGSRMVGAPVRPSNAYDAAGTALTAVLLLSAVLATRVVSARRARTGGQDSIPFEGGLHLPGGSGRHRLA